MALNIKNERVSELAHELAILTGASITDAVASAIEAKLAEVRRARRREELAERLMAIGRNCVRLAPPEWRTRDFDRELYDEQGLPR